ncbi:MAG: ATP synthase F0 subunit B [Acidobacteriia bacterium]|nr:ATP synthase F0 subunit B [Terriglobia bacterium]
MNFPRRIRAYVSGSLLALFVLALPAFAAEGAEPNPADSPAGLIFRWLNFALVFGGIAYLIAKHGGAFFGANAKAISASIREGAAAKEEATRQLQEVETKISRLDQEVTTLRESARRDSAAETERLNASGQAEIEKIQIAARAELSAAERAARQELRALAASLAVERAGELVASRMDKNIRSKLMRAFLNELGRSAN